MPDTDKVDEDGTPATASPTGAHPTGADIVAALADSPLGDVGFARLSVPAKVRPEPFDVDDGTD